jgi:RNA polymerase sigma-70 factor (ECF subfamily)
MALDGTLLDQATDARPERLGRTSPVMMPEAQFEAFYRRTASGVWSYLYRLAGDAATADDLLQKTFYRFLRSGFMSPNDEHLRAYLYRTATNLAVDHFRDTKRERERNVELPPASASRSERHELRQDMMRVFAELKPQERALLWLAHVEESNHQEIGEALGVKAQSVRVLLHRARKRLAGILTSKGLAPEVKR